MGDHDATNAFEDVDSVPEYDRHRLHDWNQEMPALVNSLVHGQIETQCENYPLNEAVCAWDGTLPYKELNQRANALARRLTAAGVHVGDYVPLLFEKSKWYIVSIFAVKFLGSFTAENVLTSASA